MVKDSEKANDNNNIALNFPSDSGCRDNPSNAAAPSRPCASPGPMVLIAIARPAESTVALVRKEHIKEIFLLQNV